MGALVDFCLENRAVVVLGTLVLAIWGLVLTLVAASRSFPAHRESRTAGL